MVPIAANVDGRQKAMWFTDVQRMVQLFILSNASSILRLVPDVAMRPTA
jgi:hypothetical protein